MKAILISIKPEWVAKILNGEKTIEIRKTMPKCDLPVDVYIYCTKGKDKLEYCDINEGCWSANDGGDYYNGKVVAKFTLNKVEEIVNVDGEELIDLPVYRMLKYKDLWHAEYSSGTELVEGSCLSREELHKYLNNKTGYAIHISDLEIFDKPKELSEFKIPCDFKCPKLGCSYCHKNTKLTKAPQSYCFIETEDK